MMHHHGLQGQEPQLNFQSEQERVGKKGEGCSLGSRVKPVLLSKTTQKCNECAEGKVV